MNPILTVALIGLVGFGVLGFAAYRMMRDERAKPNEYKFSAEKPAAAPEPAPRLNPPGAHEVLRLLRDDLSGRIMIEIGGQRFNRVMEIQDPNLGRGLVTTVRDLQRFMQGQVTGGGSLPEIPPPALSAPPPSTALDHLPAPEPPRSFTPAPAAPPLPLPSMNPFKQAQILREMKKQQLVAPKSIPEQIDEVLQEKIAGTPLVRRGLKVQTSPAGGVLFMLDGQGCEGVDAVPDPEAQAVIRAAVKEWENKK